MLTVCHWLFTFLLLFLLLLCSMVRSLVRLWFYGMWRMRMVGMVNIRMLMMLATYYSLYHRCSSSMDNWSRIYENNFVGASFRNNYNPYITQNWFSKSYLIDKCVPWSMESKYFPVLLRYWNNWYCRLFCILCKIDENIFVVILSHKLICKENIYANRTNL